MTDKYRSFVLSNHAIAHARTAYEDHAAPQHTCHLLRLWLSIIE